MVALVSGLETLLDRLDRDQDLPIMISTDSLSALATLCNGPAAQTSPLGLAAWKALSALCRDGRTIHAQPSVSPHTVVWREINELTGWRERLRT